MSPNNNTSAPQSNTMGRVAKEAAIHVGVEKVAEGAINAGGKHIMPTVEAELSKSLNISWADARDLASYARGKVGIIPGDKLAEQTQRQNILTAAIEADNQLPKKRNLPKSRGHELHKEEKNSNPKQDTLAGPELDKGVQDKTAPTSAVMMDRGNFKVANEAAADETTEAERNLACAEWLQCLECVGACGELFSLCNC